MHCHAKNASGAWQSGTNSLLCYNYMAVTKEEKDVVNLLFHQVFPCPLVFLQTVIMATKCQIKHRLKKQVLKWNIKKINKVNRKPKEELTVCKIVSLFDASFPIVQILLAFCKDFL